MEAFIRHEKTCDELVKHTFPGGKYDKSKSIFDKKDDIYIIIYQRKQQLISCIKNYNPVVTNNNDKHYPMSALLILKQY